VQNCTSGDTGVIVHSSWSLTTTTPASLRITPCLTYHRTVTRLHRGQVIERDTRTHIPKHTASNSQEPTACVERPESDCDSDLVLKLHVNYEKKSQDNFQSIIESPYLSIEVTAIRFTSCERTIEEFCRRTKDNRDRPWEFVHLIQYISHLRKLREFELAFSLIWAPKFSRWFPEWEGEGPGYRFRILRSIFSMLGDSLEACPNFHSLTLKNLQCQSQYHSL
jgi:hypothetical protein